jgi:uncharacterized protein (TIGR01777 family)
LVLKVKNFYFNAIRAKNITKHLKMTMENSSKIKVLISGAAGLVGQSLCKMLEQKGYEPIILSRKKNDKGSYRTIVWDLEKQQIGDEGETIEADYIIHLAGAGIADKKWSEKRKSEIISSRVDGAALLAKLISGMKQKPKAYISAAAIGIYGNRGEELLDENSPIRKESSEFLVQSCIAWEDSAKKVSEMGIRTALLRIGIVLSTRGGALTKMLPSYKFGTGAYFGNGQQYFSWIHIEDLCRAFVFMIENENCSAAYNATAPNPERNKVLAKKIAGAKKQSALLLPVPAFALKLAMGEMSAIVLDSANVQPKRLLAEGFEFKFPDLKVAIEDLLRRGV